MSQGNFNPPPPLPGGYRPYGPSQAGQLKRGGVKWWLIALFAVPLIGIAVAGWRMYDRRTPPRRPVESIEQKYAAAKEAFASRPVTVTAQNREVLALVDRLAKALLAQDTTTASRLVDLDRMIQEIKQLGGMQGLSVREERALKQGMAAGLRQAFAAQGCSLAWDRHEVRAVQLREGGREAVVYLRTVSTANPERIGKLRWFVWKDGGAWKAYDWEDLDLGVRATDTTADLLKQFNPRAGAPPWAGANANLQQAQAALIGNDVAAAEQALKALDAMSLPPQMEATRWMLWSTVRVAQSRPQEALDAAGKAEAARQDMPVLWPLRAKALNQLGKHREAFEQADKYVQTLGGDADTFADLGAALEGLGRTDEAAAAFARGLADAPGSPNNAAGLARTGGKADWGAVLGKAADPRPLFTTIAAEVRMGVSVDPQKATEAAATLDALVAAYRRLRPADPWAAYYDAEAKSARKQHADAAAALEKVLTDVPEADRPEFQGAFVRAMLDAGKPVDGYAKSPDAQAALKQLAWRLQDKKDWTSLKALVTAHKSRVPGDAWGPYYEAILVGEGENRGDDADALFASAMNAASNDQERNSIRHARVTARAKDGKGLLAYQQADDRQKVYTQLAWLYSGENKPDDLEKLVAAHRAALPADPILPFWEAEALFLRKDYAGAVAKLTESRSTIPQDLEHMTRDRLVRSLIRQGQHDQALRQTRTAGQKADDPFYRLMGLAAKGDAAEAAPLITELIDNEGYDLAELYDDPDIGLALATDAMKPVRDKYPRPKDDVEARQ